MALAARETPTAPLEAEAARAASGPVWFGDAARPLFGWFHAARGPAKDCVVVLCNPFGYDAMIAHYAYRHLAERLAEAGVAALRFDYYGTGDSSGDDAAPERVTDWIESIGVAAVEARARSGARATALFGLRLGALFALAAAERAPVDDLVLLGPPPSGRAAVRELRALRMLQPPIPRPGDPEGRAHEDENFGFLLTEPMRVAVSAIDPRKGRAAVARRALVIGRDDVAGGEAPLEEHLRACGVEVISSKTPGYSLALRGDPYTRDLPDAAWREIVEFVAAGHPPLAARARLEPHAGAAIALGDAREEAVRFRGLFGVLTEPASGAHARTGVVLLSIGANHRIGSNRMYVRWARAWASLGVAVLRLDLSSIGDSPALPGRLDKDVYSPLGIAEARAAVDLLASRGCDSFVLAGLCSGAYVSFYAALEDARVRGVVLVNPPTFHWKEGDSLELRTRNSFQATSFYTRRAFDVRTWTRALRGEVHLRAVGVELARRLVARGKARASEALVRLGVIAEPNDVARGFQTLSARGCEALLVYGSNDGGVDVMEGHLGPGAKKMRDADGFRVEIVDGTDHTFTPRAAQDALTARLTDFVSAITAKPRAAPTPARAPAHRRR